MAGILIFGGTTEGRIAAEKEKGALVCVTSAYAASLLPPGTDCRIGKLDKEQMYMLMNDLRPERVIDATHPFAILASENIRSCCQQLGLSYERIERPRERSDWDDAVCHVQNAEEAAQKLKEFEGNILLTTGSHTLKIYSSVISPFRLWVRVLPTAEALSICNESGIPASHIIAMQGPFSRELNAALYDQLLIRVMVTKESGAAGGLAEKVEPALEREIDVIMIDRPKEDPCAEKA